MRFYRIYALLVKYWYISFAKLERLFDVIYWPILDVILWGLASYFIKSISNINLLSMFLGGVILWVFVWRSSQDIAIFVLEDFWSRNLYNLFASPITTLEHTTSIIIFGFVRSLLSFFFLILLAFLLYSFNFFSINLLYIAMFIPVLLLVGWVMGLFVTSFIMRFGKSVQIFAWSIVWVIQPFSCIFYPLNALPGWAQKIAVLLPTTYVFESLRSVINTGTFQISNLFYSYIISIIALFLVSFYLISSIKKAKKTGLLAKYE